MDSPGTLQTHDGRYQLVFTRSLEHAPEKVWRAITEPEHLRAWFPSEMHGERKPGAALKFTSEGGEFEGHMRVFDPPRVMEFVWGDDEVMRFEIEPTATGCVLTLVNTIDAQGKAARDAAGWHACLDFLEYELAGTPAPWSSPVERWSEVKDFYADTFGPEASTIGPPG